MNAETLLFTKASSVLFCSVLSRFFLKTVVLTFPSEIQRNVAADTALKSNFLFERSDMMWIIDSWKL